MWILLLKYLSAFAFRYAYTGFRVTVALAAYKHLAIHLDINSVADSKFL
jgi:hypothetical protein